jgi:transcriptional regulator with XRE-family HTH domain
MAIDWKDAVGRAIRRERRGQRLSQESLAELSGMSRTYISQIESGSASLSLEAFIAVASALKMTPSELLHEAEGLAKPRKAASR